MKHTPGPWAWYTGGNHKALVRPGVDGRILMQRDADGDLIYEDARLISAAPDLLTALEAVLEANPLPAGMTERRGVMAQAEAAVKKAREG